MCKHNYKFVFEGLGSYQKGVREIIVLWVEVFICEICKKEKYLINNEIKNKSFVD